MSTFGEGYAASYDTFYANKDYKAECDAIETLIKEIDGEVRSLLDIGCGTGGHAFEMAGRGYEVTGVDLSPEMLKHAREKSVAGLNVSFVEGDARDFSLDRTFDAVLMMFAVLGYQTTNSDVLQTLRNMRRHASAGAPFVFDVWFGPGVLSQRPASRTKVMHEGPSTIIRASDGRLDVERHLCEVDIQVWTIEGRQLQDEYRERHEVRFFFPQELDLLLRSSGFELVKLTGWPNLADPVNEQSWNVAGLARAV